jgi:hypothetical protein
MLDGGQHLRHSFVSSTILIILIVVSLAMTGKTFTDANRIQQIKLLEVLDKESFSDNGTDVFFREFKALVVFGYYSSEEGASVELRYDRIPVVI